MVLAKQNCSLSPSLWSTLWNACTANCHSCHFIHFLCLLLKISCTFKRLFLKRLNGELCLVVNSNPDKNEQARQTLKSWIQVKSASTAHWHTKKIKMWVMMYLLSVVIFGTWNIQGEIVTVASLYFWCNSDVILMHYLEIIHSFEKLTNGDMLCTVEEIISLRNLFVVIKSFCRIFLLPVIILLGHCSKSRMEFLVKMKRRCRADDNSVCRAWFQSQTLIKISSILETFSVLSFPLSSFSFWRALFHVVSKQVSEPGNFHKIKFLFSVQLQS